MEKAAKRRKFFGALIALALLFCASHVASATALEISKPRAEFKTDSWKNGVGQSPFYSVKRDVNYDYSGTTASESSVAPKTTAGTRANQVHEVLDPRAQRMRTTAVTETAEGTRVVSSSNRRLSPAQRAQLGPNEIEGVGVGHAEVTGINAAQAQGLTPTGTAASRPICPDCATHLNQNGVQPLSPLKKPRGG